MWGAYGIGKGKLLPYSSIVMYPEKATSTKTCQQFFPFESRTMVSENSKETEKQEQVFKCTIPSCGKILKCYGSLNLHLEMKLCMTKYVEIGCKSSLTIDVRPKGAQKSPAEAGNKTLLTNCSKFIFIRSISYISR